MNNVEENSLRTRIEKRKRERGGASGTGAMGILNTLSSFYSNIFTTEDPALQQTVLRLYGGTTIENLRQESIALIKELQAEIGEERTRDNYPWLAELTKE